MSWLTRRRAQRGLFWILLLGMTGLGASWVERGADDARPADPRARPLSDEDRELAPPRIVFPGADDDRAWDGPALGQHQ